MILKIIFLFILFSIIGWLIEVIYRSIMSKHFVNPDFMTGIANPLYGIGGLVLVLIATKINLINNNYKYLIYFLLSAIVLTLIEYLYGFLFLKHYRLKLWDYSSNKFNYNGLVCLLFSFFWGILGLFFYLFLYKYLGNIMYLFFSNTYCIFFLGIIVGIFIIDLICSFKLLKLIKKYSYLIRKIINIEELKMELLGKRFIFLPNLVLKKRLVKIFIVKKKNRQMSNI